MKKRGRQVRVAGAESEVPPETASFSEALLTRTVAFRRALRTSTAAALLGLIPFATASQEEQREVTAMFANVVKAMQAGDFQIARNAVPVEFDQRCTEDQCSFFSRAVPPTVAATAPRAGTALLYAWRVKLDERSLDEQSSMGLSIGSVEPCLPLRQFAAQLQLQLRPYAGPPIVRHCVPEFFCKDQGQYFEASLPVEMDPRRLVALRIATFGERCVQSMDLSYQPAP